MTKFKTYKTLAVMLGALTISLALVQCTKDGENATRVTRALVEQPDSTVFASFYDTTKVPGSDNPADVNDIIKIDGIYSIVQTYCASANCHGGAIAPKLTTFNEIRSIVTPGNPEASELFELITTNDLHKAMPPINYGMDLSITEKVKIYNWIRNGAKERPDLQDYRPAAISLSLIHI